MHSFLQKRIKCDLIYDTVEWKLFQMECKGPTEYYVLEIFLFLVVYRKLQTDWYTVLDYCNSILITTA
jgi:hypothetical protein